MNHRQEAASVLLKEAGFNPFKFAFKSNEGILKGITDEAKKKTVAGRVKSGLKSGLETAVPVVGAAGIGGTILASSALTNRSFGEGY